MLKRLKPTPFLLFPILALITLAVYIITPYNSDFIERIYSRGIFEYYRIIWDYTIGYLPFGLVYLLIPLVFLYIFWPLKNAPKFRDRVVTFSLRVIKVLSIGIISFYWLWAFNYKRSTFYKNTSLEHARPDNSFVYQEYCRVTDSLVSIRNLIDVEAYEDGWSNIDVCEEQLRDDLKKTYELIGIPHTGRVRAIKLRPKGSLLHISTAGVYLPFVGQGHIDAGLHPITHPFTIMHEMSHGYGWTGEDVCNFLALLGTVNSGNPYTRYSGYFGYWRYLRSQVYQIDTDHFEEFYREGPDLVMKDYKEILSYSDRYPDVMPILRDIFYDQYLKSHGISSGLINYSQMIILSFDWQKKYGSLSLDSVSNAKG